MKSRLSFILPLLGFLILLSISGMALLGTLSGNRDVTQLPSVLIGKTPPQTDLPLLSDPTAFLDFSAVSGEVAVINFFASWCAPCRAEAPALEALSQQMPVIGISYKDRPEDTQAFLRQYGNPFNQIGIDFYGQAALRWGLYGVPETYILNKQGQIILRHAGPIDKGVIDRVILPAIEKAK
jgi:cytochrome c biogenesis protein CcmG/thiol:disulfide interchange protein DsbE